MKKHPVRQLSFILVATVLLGCTSVLKETPELVRAATTNFVSITQYVTNVVTLRVATTNLAGEITPAVVQPQVLASVSQVPVVVPAIFTTNYSIAPAVATGATVAGALAPVPWGGTAAAGLLAIGNGILAWVNHRRKQKALGEKETFETATRVGVQSLEMLRKVALTIPQYTPEIDRRVMKGVVGLQVAAGIKTVVGDIVTRTTGDTVAEAKAAA